MDKVWCKELQTRNKKHWAKFLWTWDMMLKMVWQMYNPCKGYKMMAEFLLSSNLYTIYYYSCKQSLDQSAKDKIISSQTKKKLLQCSLVLSRNIYKRNTLNGIINVFMEKSEGSKIPRISMSNAVIDKLITYLNAWYV